jgi:hypothetical protein
MSIVFGVFMVVVIHTSIIFFWIVMACNLVRGYQRFGGTYYLHPVLITVLMFRTCLSLLSLSSG